MIYHYSSLTMVVDGHIFLVLLIDNYQQLSFIIHHHSQLLETIVEYILKLYQTSSHIINVHKHS